MKRILLTIFGMSAIWGLTVSAQAPLPATFPIATQAEFSSYGTVDANDDGKTWKFESKAACYEGLGVTVPADDWLILGPIDLSAGSSYTLTHEAWQTYRPESYEICLSPSGEIADAVAIFTSGTIPNSAAPFSSDFTVATPGVYHLMIHATTQSAGISLYVRNVQIAANGPEGFTIPFEMLPEADEARHFTVINANNDAKTWSYDLTNKGFAIECPQTEDSDDWLMFPEVEFSAAGRYLFQWDARSWGDPQVMEVCIGQGDDPTDFGRIYREPEIGGNLYTREALFEIPEAGAYRMALHCTTPANRYKLLTKNYRITQTERQLPLPLPLDISTDTEVNEEWTFASPFLYGPQTRVKVTGNIQGDPVTLAFADAPAEGAIKNRYELEASADGHAEKVFWLPSEGVGYLGFKSSGNSTVSGLRAEIFTEADEAYQLPFMMQPTAEEFEEFLTVNANGDASTWSYYDQFGAAKYNWSNTDKADDWLILPAINIPDASEMISFGLKARGMAVTLPETFEIWAGESATPDEMTKLYDSPEIRTEQFMPLSFSFAPQWTGVTHFAVRATSEPKMFHLFVRDFEIQADGRPTTIPTPPTAVTANPSHPGSTDATVSFAFPLLNEHGDTLDPSGMLTATVTSPVATATTTGLPGTQASVTLANGQGEGEIIIVIANEFGESNASVTKVYTGVDRPSKADVVSVKADETNRKATVSWIMEETGASGGYIEPSEVTFTIRHSVGNGSYQSVGTVKGANEFTYSIPDSYPLEMHYFMVTPSNIAGEGEQGRGTGIMLGRPHSIPASEDFSSGTIELGPLGMSNPDESYTLDWYFDNPALGFDEAANLSGKALVAFTEEEGAARGRLNLPKFDTRTDKGARISVRLFNYPHFAQTDIYASTASGEDILIGSVAPTTEPGWKEYSFALPESLMDRQWIAPYLDFGFEGTYDDEIWMLDRYEMANQYDVDVELRPVATHPFMYADTETEWRFEICNFGSNQASFPHPKLDFTNADGECISFHECETDVLETLESGESRIIRIPVCLGTTFEGEVSWDITVNSAGEGYADNNLAAGRTEVWQQEEFVVRDLSGIIENDGVHLQWSAPSTGYGILYMDNLRSWDYGPKLGMFTNCDGDGQIETGFVGFPFPGMNAPKAWQVFDYESGGFDVIYAGHLGSAKSLIAFSPAGGLGAADDWLISPEVRGGTQLTFYVRPLHFGYGREKVEIMVSETGDRPEDFRVLETYQTAEGDPSKTPYWEEVEVMLPESARFFAIRYASDDIFGLQLDDVIYTPAQEDSEALTYTIFRNDIKIAEGIQGTEYVYVPTTTATGTYSIAVEKAYGGLYPKSNEVTMDTSGITGITDSCAKPIYYDLGGRRIASPTEPGVYIRIQGTERRKIIAR